MMAFGGVATGIIKAADAPIAVVSNNTSGRIPMAGAAAAKIGNIAAVKAVFEVTSVAKITKAATPMIMPYSGNAARLTVQRFRCQCHGGAGHGKLQNFVFHAEPGEIGSYFLNGHGITPSLLQHFPGFDR